jgi:hypothetical protein
VWLKKLNRVPAEETRDDDSTGTFGRSETVDELEGFFLGHEETRHAHGENQTGQLETIPDTYFGQKLFCEDRED